MTQTIAPRPWYREPWPWILIGLPLSVVIASAYTIYLANQSADSLVTDHYYKRGLAVGGDIHREHYAMRLHLQGNMGLEKGVLMLVLNQGADVDTVRLRLRHPRDSQRDVDIDLHKIAPGRYQAFAPPLEPVRYRVHVETREWRLAGVWKPGSDITLLPGV